jgi:hypothetical protein
VNPLVITDPTYNPKGSLLPTISTSSKPIVQSIINSTTINVVNAALGTVNITIPANLYTGAIIPDARKNVPITIVGVSWTTATTPSQVNSHRWAFIQCYEPDVDIGNPILSTGFTALTIA